MATYYAYRAIAFFDRTSGVLTLIAVMFTVTWIQRHHEMTALLAAGISRTARAAARAARRDLASASLAAANREFVMPNIREHLATDSKNLGGEQQSRHAVPVRQPDRHLHRRRQDRPCRAKDRQPKLRAPAQLRSIRQSSSPPREARLPAGQ